MRFRCLLLLLVLTCSMASAARTLTAQSGTVIRPAPQNSVPAAQSRQPFDADLALNELITHMVLRHLPHTWSRDKDWGHQQERWDGIKWKLDGWQVKTKRRKKSVNHGTWKKYSATLIDPQRQFDVKMTNIHQNAQQQLAFQLTFATRIRLQARQTEWVKGVQLYSLSAEGQAAIRLTVDMVLGMALDPTKFPPDLVFSPRATAAEIAVDDFRIDRISKLGGEFAIQVTKLARRELDDEIAEKEIELVQKINKEIEEDRDKLRISMSKAISSQWGEKAKPFLPKPIQQAVQAADR